MRDWGMPPGLPSPWGARGVAAVAAIVVLLAVAWPVASAALPSSHSLTAGRVLVVGPDPVHRARFTVGRGWSLVPAASDPRHGYRLRRGGICVTVAYVSLLHRGDSGRLWAGLRRDIQAAHPGARLGAEHVVAVRRARPADFGSLSEGSMAGEAMIFPDLPEDFAIEVTVLAPRGSAPAGQQAAARLIRSLRLELP